jgi:replicative DNA helicase
MLAIIAKDLFHHEQILNKFIEKFANFVEVREVSVGVSFSKFGRKYLSEDLKDDERVEVSGKKQNKKTRIKDIDRKIISITQTSGRIKFSHMAKILHQDSDKIRRHYEKLVKNNIIEGVTYSINPNYSEIKFFRLLFKLSGSIKREKDF